MKVKAIDIEYDYIPKETRKKFKLGEYAEKDADVDIKVSIETKDGSMKADGVEAVEKLLESLDN